MSDGWFTHSSIPRRYLGPMDLLGFQKSWIRRSNFYQFFRRSRPRAPVEAGASSVVITRDTRRRGLNSPCISPYLGFRARSDCRRERGDLGGNERAEPPRCMARGSLSDECIYVSHSPPILFGDKSNQRDIAVKIYSQKDPAFFTFNARFCAKIQIALFPPFRLVTFPKRVPNGGGGATRISFAGLTTRKIAAQNENQAIMLNLLIILRKNRI